jgi:general secretion pathway protein D
MRKLFISFIAFPLTVLAAPISFNFNEVSILAFSQTAFKNLLHVDYVISPDVLAMDRKITLSVADVEQSKVLEFVEGILRQQGISVENRRGVYYLVPAVRGDTASVPVVSLSSPVIAAPAEPFAQDLPLVIDPRRGAVRKDDDESELFTPSNRSSDFLVAVLAASFGDKSVVAAGADVMITGSDVQLKRMRKLLEAVDSLPKLVDVSVSWIEVTSNSATGRGLSLMANVLGAKLGVSLGAVGASSALSVKHANFELVIDALNTDGRFKQVSNSRVVGDDYEKLVLTVGDETPTISSTGRDNSGNPVQNVVYRPSGVIVDVLPKVLGNGRIQLLVDGQISSFKATATGVTASPTLIKRQVKTKVTVGDGDVLLIGGLNDQQSSGTSNALAFLPFWPVKSNSSAQTDLVLVLSAKVLLRP